MFINLIKKSFDDVIKNPIITLFLVLYFIITSIIMTCISLQRNEIVAIVLILTAFLFIAIFIAGWFGVFKEISVQNPNEPKEKSYIAVFLENIGINVIPCTIGLVIYFIFSLLFAYVAYIISLKLFGNPHEIIQQIQTFSNPNDAIEFIKGIPQDKLVSLYALPLMLMGATSLCFFTFMYYFPAIAFNKKSSPFSKAFVALKDNFCFLFKHLLCSVCYYLILCFIYVSVMMLKTIVPSNFAVDILFIFFIIYYMSFAIMIICNYYGQDHSDYNRADSLGENESDNSVSEEE